MAEQVLDRDLRRRINGEIVVFEKGMTHDEVRSRYQSLTGGFLPGLSAGLESLKGSVGAIPDVLFGDIFGSQEAIDQAGKEYEESDKARAQALPSATDYKDVIGAYQRDGALGAIPEAYRFSAESIAQSIPYVAPSMIATKVGSSSLGLGVASYLAKATPFLARAAVSVPIPVLKAGLGVAAGVGTLALQFFGDNMQRQYETAKAENPEERVTPEDLNTFTAALAAAPQAGMDYIVIALTGGAGRGPQIAAARSLKESLGAVGATAKAAVSPTLGQTARASLADSALEFPTEMLQTILERAQAGLSISPQDAEFVEEMIATVAGTIPVAGAFGAYGTQRSYRANKKAYKDWEKLSEEEKVIRNDYEKRRESSVQAEYDNSVRIYGENVREVEKKFDEAEMESAENRRDLEQGVQDAKDAVTFSAGSVLEAAESRNIKTDDKAFKAFVYRTTNGQTNDINEADQDALRAMRTILTGFTVQDYYDAETEEGVSVPSFTSEEVESVIKGLKSGSRITPEVVRKKLHEKFFSKAKGTGNLVDFTDSESSNDIASSIIEEMKMKGYAVEDKNGNVKARKPKYTESQYRDLMERAYKDGSINLRDYEQITGRFGEKNFESFLDDAVVRGDMPQRQSSSIGDGEFAPLVFRAAFSEDAAEQGGNLEPVVGPDGRPVIRASKGQQEEIKRRLTAGNTVTEVVGANGYFIRDENGQIVGGATSKAEANKEANFLNENRAKYKIVDQVTGNPAYGTKRKLNAIIQVSKGAMTAQGRASGSPDYTGVTPELVEGSFSVDNSKSEGFAVRQFLSPGLKVKNRETGELIETGESFGPRRPKVTEISFAPDVKTASSVEFEFAKEMMPGASNWDKKADEVGKTKRAELQQLFDDEGRQFRPPSISEVFQNELISSPERPTEISKRAKVLKEIPEGSRAKGEEVLKVIENKLKEANLDKALIGTVMNKIERVGTDGEVEAVAEGSYSPNDDGFRRIAISLDQIKDANTAEEIRIAVASIMDHEIVHAMRDLDLFTMQEWNVLSTSAYRVKNKDGVTFFDQASQDYEGKNTEYITEEAVAEMYRQYYSVPEVRRQIAGQPRTLIERMAIFMEKLYNAMSGAGFVTAADAISGMKKIQARESGEVRTKQGDRNPLVSQAIEVEEAEEEVAGQPVAESVISDTPTDPETRAELGRDPVDANADARTEDLDAERFSEPERLAFDRPYGYKVTENDTISFESMFVSDNGIMYKFNSDNDRGAWYTSFQSEGGVSSEAFGITGEEKFGALRVLGTIRNILRDFIVQKRPGNIIFASSKTEGGKGSRSRIYERGIRKIAKDLNYDIEITEDSNQVQFDMSRKSEPATAEGERLSAVPLAPGTAPIPDGHFRFFHYTAADPKAIGREGIDISFARGHLDSEPDQIWATTESPDKVFKTFVEFSLPPDDPRIGGTISRERLGIDSQATFTGSINPEDIIAVHERWHDSHRWIMNNPKKLKEVLEGKHDRLLNEDPVRFGRAVSEIKNSARSEERLSTAPNQGSARNSSEPERFSGWGKVRAVFDEKTGLWSDGAFRSIKGKLNSTHLAENVDQIPTSADLVSRLNVNQRGNVEANRELTPYDDRLLPGGVAKLRIDIPFFNKTGKYAVTVHGKGKGVGKPVGFDSIVRLLGLVKFDAKEKSAENILYRGNDKFPLATVEGKLTQEREIPTDIDFFQNKDGRKGWVPVGYDPHKAVYFYDKDTGQEVKAGTDAVSVGNTVYTKNPQYGTRKIPRSYQARREAVLQFRARAPRVNVNVNDNARAREDERSQRSVLIAEGKVEPERLSSTNRDRVKKRKPRPDRDIEAIESQLFAPPNEESWFETTQKALFDSDKRKEWMARFRMIFLNKFDYLEKVTREAGLKMKDNREILASTNSASLALLSDRANSIVSAAINNGALIIKGGIARVDPTKKSLKQALNPLFEKDEYLYRKWGTWMVANRAGRLIKDGKLTSLTSNEIDTINKDVASKGLLPMFEQVRNDYEQWNDALVDFMRDTGVVSEDLARVFKKYGDYIPFYRNLDLDGKDEGGGVDPAVFKLILEAEGIDLSLGANRRLKNLFPTLTDQSQPKKLKGGDMQLSDPLTGIMQNLRAAVIAGTKNLAAQRVMIDAVDAEMATEVFADSNGRVDPGAYTVRVNGEEKYFTTTDRLLIDTLTAFTQGKVNVWPLFSKPANFLRESVSRSPLFMARNLVRDSMSVWVTSGADMTPVIDTMKKFTADLQGKGGSDYSILENSGVVGGYEYVFEPKAFEKDFRKKMRKEGMTLKGNSADTVGVVFSKIWDKLGETSQMSDAATRQVIYEDTLQSSLNKGVGRAEAESEAIFQAMETLNFSRRGNSAVLSAIMTMVPFLNARMQGLDVMYRGARGRYKSNRDGENNALKSILARGGMIAFATLMYTLASHEDDEYKGASETVRDQNWLIAGLRIPIPFEVGFLFKTIPERITRLALGDDTLQDGFDALLTGLVNTFELPITGPQALAPVAEVLVNKNWYTGRPVVPDYLSNRPSGGQYKYYTAEYAKALGETFNVSPLKIEHILNGYSGTMGSYLLATIDSAYKMANGIPIMTNWRSNEIPVIGALFQSADASTGQMQRWSDLIFSVRGIHAEMQAAREEDPDKYNRLNEKYRDIISAKPRLDSVNSRIDKLRSRRRAAYLSRTMTDDQKRREFDSIDKEIKQTLSGTEDYRDLLPGPIPFLRGIN